MTSRGEGRCRQVSAGDRARSSDLGPQLGEHAPNVNPDSVGGAIHAWPSFSRIPPQVRAIVCPIVRRPASAPAVTVLPGNQPSPPPPDDSTTESGSVAGICLRPAKSFVLHSWNSLNSGARLPNSVILRRFWRSRRTPGVGSLNRRGAHLEISSGNGRSARGAFSEARPSGEASPFTPAKTTPRPLRGTSEGGVRPGNWGRSVPHTGGSVTHRGARALVT